MKKVIAALAVIAAAVLAGFGFMIWRARSGAAEAVSAYNALAQDYNDRIAPYNQAAARIAAANDELQGVLDAAGAVVKEAKEAYEPDTLETLRETADKARKVLVEVPVQIDPFAQMESPGGYDRAQLEAQKIEAEASAAAVQESMARIPAVPEVPDYAGQISAVQAAEKAYAASVQKLANVTAPPDAFVRDRIGRIRTVVQTEAAAEGNDPNQMLGKKGGYLSCVYFLDSRILEAGLLPEDVMPDGQDGQEDETGPEDAESAETEASEAGSAAAELSADGASGETAAVAEEAGRQGTETEASEAGNTAAEMAADGASGETAAAAGQEPAPEARYHVVTAGTEGGGAVEVYATAGEAQARDEYLAFFEGSVMDPGAHAVEGTCVLRASRHLEAAQQQALIEDLRAALLEVD